MSAKQKNGCFVTFTPHQLVVHTNLNGAYYAKFTFRVLIINTPNVEKNLHLTSVRQ